MTKNSRQARWHTALVPAFSLVYIQAPRETLSQISQIKKQTNKNPKDSVARYLAIKHWLEMCGKNIKTQCESLINLLLSNVKPGDKQMGEA